VSPLLTALRPRQWAKNLFVLAPLVFAHGLTDTAALGRGLLAFAAFCAAASAVYLINDVVDREEDRRHPLKRQRPIASGALSTALALGIAIVLVAVAALSASRIGAAFGGWLAGYLALNLAYSWWLKQVVILDVMTIAMGFVVRVLAGAEAAAVPVSSWLLLCTTFLSLFLAFSKRRHELGLLQGAAADQRRVLSSYSPAFLDQMINVVTASAVVSYALYAVAPETVAKYGGEQLIFTIPMVLFGVFRYLFLMYQRTGEKNPTETILGDAPFLIKLLIWALAVVWIVYRGSPVRP
jgi:4-hydroxybenzoate polyprenyltransferase